MRTQKWFGGHRPDFIGKDFWLPNCSDLNRMWAAKLVEFNKYNSKPQNTSELKIVSQTIWDKLPNETICRAIISFRKRLNACVSAGGAHFKHSIS